MNPIESLTGYITEINAIYEDLEKQNGGKTLNALFFRGHSKTSYELLPTALRKGVNETEKVHLLNYRDNMPRHSQSYDFIKQRTEILADMQHFGMNTRLLDWTFSPLIALYFALKRDNSKDSYKKNSEVCVFNPWVYRERFFGGSIKKDSSAHDMHVLARALLSTHKVSEIQTILEAEFHGASLKEDELRLPYPFVAKYGNQRLIHQSGCFTIHGVDVTQGSLTVSNCFNDPSVISKILILESKRSEIMKELNRVFINHYSVYPDLEGMSEHLKEYDSLYSVSRKPSQK